MTDREEFFIDGAMTAPSPIAADGGRVVPVYALTGGRTRSTTGRDMPVETLVTGTGVGTPGDLQLEYRTTVEMAVAPVSIVEIGAALRVPVGVARVLVNDLVDAGYLEVHLPPSTPGGPSPAILERLLEAPCPLTHPN